MMAPNFLGTVLGPCRPGNTPALLDSLLHTVVRHVGLCRTRGALSLVELGQHHRFNRAARNESRHEKPSVTTVAVGARLVCGLTGELLWTGTAHANSVEQQNRQQGGQVGRWLSAVDKQIISTFNDKSHPRAGSPNGMLFAPTRRTTKRRNTNRRYARLERVLPP